MQAPLSSARQDKLLQHYLASDPPAHLGLAEILIDQRFALSQRAYRLCLPDAPNWHSRDLHQLRVRLRHARTLWKLYFKVCPLPPETQAAFMLQLKTLGQLSSQARDYDVLLLKIERQRDTLTLPDKLHSLLQHQRYQAYESLLNALHQKDIQSLMKQWTKKLHHEPEQPQCLSNVARKALQRASRAIVSHPLDTVESYHDLRKDFKRLRYLSADFKPLFEDSLGPLFKNAKRMQAELGKLQDLASQAMLFQGLADSLAKAAEQTPNTASNNSADAELMAHFRQQAHHCDQAQHACLPAIDESLLGVRPHLETLLQLPKNP